MKLLIIANWKMNPQSLQEAKRIFDSIKRGVRNIKNVEVVICPPFIFMPSVGRQTPNVKIGAQNVFWEEKGAYTGEISPEMLKNSGCQYVIVGHSERRKYFTETDEIVNKKLKKIIETKLIPVLCIGETQEERNKEQTETILKRQIELGLKEVSGLKFQA